MSYIRKIFVSWQAGLLALLGLMLLPGCVITDTNPPQAPKGTNDFKRITEQHLRVGEQLTVEFFDINPPQQIQLTVPADGDITLMLGKKVNVLNKTVSALQNEIRDMYVPELYRRLTVNIKREIRFIYVRGEVKNAGRFPHIGEMTVLKAIAAASGFTVYADKKNVEIIRSTGETQKMNAEKARKDPRKYDLPLYPDDQVNVPLRPY